MVADANVRNLLAAIPDIALTLFPGDQTFGSYHTVVDETTFYEDAPRFLQVD